MDGWMESQQKNANEKKERNVHHKLICTRHAGAEEFIYESMELFVIHLIQLSQPIALNQQTRTNKFYRRDLNSKSGKNLGWCSWLEIR